MYQCANVSMSKETFDINNNWHISTLAHWHINILRYQHISILAH